MGGLSIKKLQNIYNEFTAGFKSPATDVCCHYTILDYKIKTYPAGSKERNQVIIKKRIHKRANAFYQLMRQEVKESVSNYFDLQKIQPLSKTPVQEAYYSRQIGFYRWFKEQTGK